MRGRLFVVTAFLLLGTCPQTFAQGFTEDFESYVTGSGLHGQGGWKGWDNSAKAGAPTSDKYAFSGRNSVKVIGSADLVHEFRLTGGRWEVSAMQYIPKGSTGNTYFILLNRYTDGQDGDDWSVQLNFDLDAGIVTAEIQGEGVTADVVYGRWVEHRFLIDLAGNTCAWYYAGELIHTHPWDNDGHDTLQAIDLYGNDASPVYYDDIVVSPHVIRKAYDPSPSDGQAGVLEPLLTWTAGDTARFHNVYFGADPNLTEANLVASGQELPAYAHGPGLHRGVTYYWRVDEIAADGAICVGDVWSFTAMPLVAYLPQPASGTDEASQCPTLIWHAPIEAVAHRVYFSDESESVEAAAATADKGTVTQMTFDAGLLRAGTTYYWRVDEIDPAGRVNIGDVWNFTTGQPVSGRIVREWWTGIGGATVDDLRNDPGYPGNPAGRELLRLFEGPIDWKDDYGSRLYGWLRPRKSGPYTFWIAGDESAELRLSPDDDPGHAVTIAAVTERTPRRDFDGLSGTGGAAQKSSPITLEAGRKYYIEAIMKEAAGGDNIAVAWQPPNEARVVIPGEFTDTFGLLPLRAAAPSPRNGALDTVHRPILNWFAGERAVAHDIYFGDDAAAVAEAETTGSLYRGRRSGTTFDPGDLEWGKTCFWRVDEVADGDPDSPWKGAVWCFTTAEFLPVEDFESYNDDMDAGEAVFQTWIDGVENGTGSFVGYEVSAAGTFDETTLVHGGDQSMPLAYDNLDSPFYSEAVRTWPTAQDWTVGGMDTLTVSIRGKSTSDPASLYVALEDSSGNRAAIACPDDMIVTSVKWVEWRIPLSDFAGVNAAGVKRMCIGVGNPDNPVAGGTGLVYIDDIRVIKR